MKISDYYTVNVCGVNVQTTEYILTISMVKKQITELLL